MALIPATLREDLKCGKGAISKGEKCHKGVATVAKAKEKGTAGKIATALGAGVAAGGALYGLHKYRRMSSKAKAADAKVNANKDPIGKYAQAEGEAKKLFKEQRGIFTGAQIAGAGVALAGAGLMHYGKEKKNHTAMVAGAAATYLGANVAIGGFAAKAKFKEAEKESLEQLRYVRKQAQEAQEQARRRASEERTRTGNRQGSRNVGANKAVKDPFRDLGIGENASDDEIRKRWKDLMRRNHPDLGGDPGKAQTINAAYQEIMRRRGKFDSAFAEGFSIDYEQLAV